MRRPSDRELFNKIRQAKTAVKNGAILTVDPIVIAADAIELDYQVGDLKGVISTILNEIRPAITQASVHHKNPISLRLRERSFLPFVG